MNLPDMTWSRLGELSAREIAYRSLPFYFCTNPSKGLEAWAICNLPQVPAVEMFGPGVPIFDLDDRLVFWAFYGKLIDGRVVQVLVAANAEWGALITFVGISQTPRPSAEVLASTLRTLNDAEVYLDTKADGLICYYFPRLALRGSRGGKDIVIDISTNAIYDVDYVKMRSMQMFFEYKKDRSIEWTTRLSALDDLWMDKEYFLDFSVSTVTQPYFFNLSFEAQINDDYCVPASAVMVLEDYGYQGVAQKDVAKAMNTIVGAGAASGTALYCEVKGYSVITNGALSATIYQPSLSLAQSALGNSAKQGHAFKGGNGTHAVAVSGWRDDQGPGGALFVYDPASRNGGDWRNIGCFKDFVILNHLESLRGRRQLTSGRRARGRLHDRGS